MKGVKEPPIDGLSDKDIAKVRIAIRRVWSWSTPRRLCIKRATGVNGFFYCEQCGLKSPKIFVDHMTPVGEVGDGFIGRLFCPSSKLQALCKECHNAKTKEERGGRIKKKMQSM